MSVTLDEIFTRGGRELVDILEYFVISFQMDPLFLFLVGEYRMHPTAAKAIALFDIFGSPTSPAQISAKSAVPPQDMRLRNAVQTLRTDGGEPAGVRPVVLLPPKYLFDAVAADVEKIAAEAINSIESAYDMTLTPQENLPGGEMTPGQRHFVDFVWRPHLQPRLVADGFRRVASIG